MKLIRPLNFTIDSSTQIFFAGIKYSDDFEFINSKKRLTFSIRILYSFTWYNRYFYMQLSKYLVESSSCKHISEKWNFTTGISQPKILHVYYWHYTDIEKNAKESPKFISFHIFSDIQILSSFFRSYLSF